MSDVATTEPRPISAQTAEHVLATGDLSKLTAPQRVEYVMRVCEALGLNPFTRPIRFLRLGNEIQAYFTRDGCDQLRRIHNISLHVIDQKAEAGLFTIRVQARMPSGREDEDIGAVTLPQSGEFRANAIMKCITKAKRRVTLSICGLGFLSEDELDTMPAARTFDASEAAPAPEPPQRATAQQAAQYEGGPPPQRQPAWQVWVDKLQAALAPLATVEAVDELGERDTIKKAMGMAPPWAREEALAMFAEARTKCEGYAQSEAASDEIPFDDVAIKGEEKLGAG